MNQVVSQFVRFDGVEVDAQIVDFIDRRVLEGLGISSPDFWQGVAEIFSRFAPINACLLAKRDALQGKIDDWHKMHAGEPFDLSAYQSMLSEIGYLVEGPAPFEIRTTNVDIEISGTAAPQLVVPVLNARFLLNAANARWGSLYDALYGTDAIAGAVPTKTGYDPMRGDLVVAWAKSFLDEVAPLMAGSWTEWIGGDLPLAEANKLVGYADKNILLRNHGLHIEIVIDRKHPVGARDVAGIADVILESAVTTIVDFEDSIAAVDTSDKLTAYENWLGLVRGDLKELINKKGVIAERKLNADRAYVTPDGQPFLLPGRSLLLVRNVGHLMRTPLVRLSDGSEAPEGILDSIVTALIAKHDVLRLGQFQNSREGSIYIVKPKMHGPEEVQFTNQLFDAIEDLIGLPRHTIKIGVMDEERRTSANLAACIFEARERIIFINTGFLDRTGDEIHTSMHAGPMIRKEDMRSATWMTAYENRNVQIGLATGLSQRGQIGKGMWAAPDRMADMLAQKINHPASGASTAWVPSPTAATLHSTHYHRLSAIAVQKARLSEEIAPLEALLAIPVAPLGSLTPQEIAAELDNNAQGILGYVVRWIDQGIGCSKVPDIHDVGLMEDRATLRISSQHIANWLLHGVCTAADVDSAFHRMAAKVDRQNADSPGYLPLLSGGESNFAYQAAIALVFEGTGQPNGYTEPILHRFRIMAKGGDRLCAPFSADIDRLGPEKA